MRGTSTGNATVARGASASRIGRLPARALRSLLTLRRLALSAVEPVDYVDRLITGRRRFPPLSIRRYVGPLSHLEQSGGEFAAYLKLLCGLVPTSRLLDVGCGFGLMALELETYLGAEGSYLGIDIDARSVRWAQRHITTRNGRFRFELVDATNPMYNVKGSVPAESVSIPSPPAEFDVVLFKSVFTHLSPTAVANYLRESARVICPGGSCLATFFLLSNTRGEQAEQPPAIRFDYGDDDYRFAVEEMPEAAAAHSLDAVMAMSAAAGLEVVDVRYGSWAGLKAGLSYQDIVILTPRSPDLPQAR